MRVSSDALILMHLADRMYMALPHSWTPSSRLADMSAAEIIAMNPDLKADAKASTLEVVSGDQHNPWPCARTPPDMCCPPGQDHRPARKQALC